MGQILVRNLDDVVIRQLKSRAAQSGKSLEQTVREIIAEAVRPSKQEAWAEIDRIRAMSKKSNVSSVTLIRAFRDGDDPDS
jgi:plasmid stability protein